MPWIIFGRDEDPAPWIYLPNRAGEMIDLSAAPGESAMVLFFPATGGGPGNQVMLAELHAQFAELRRLGAVVAVIADLEDGASVDLGPVPVLVDAGGALTRQYHAIFEFDTDGMAMLFVLNRYRVPFRAWVDAQLIPAEIFPKLMKYLQAVSLLCPE